MSPQSIDPNGIYTLSEACECLRMTPENLVTEISARGIPHLKVGKSYRLRGADLLDLAGGRNWREERKRAERPPVDYAPKRFQEPGNKPPIPIETHSTENLAPVRPVEPRSPGPTGEDTPEKRRTYSPQEQSRILAEYVNVHSPRIDGTWNWQPGLGPNDYFVRPNGDRVKVRTIRSWRDKGVEPSERTE